MRLSLNGSGWFLTGWYRNQWRLSRSMELKEMPVPAVATIPARVPGAVQADLMRAGIIPNVYLALNSLQAEWVTNREWFYEREFSAPGLEPDQRLYLHCEGLDYHGYIYLNQKLVGSFKEMFEKVTVDLSRLIRPGRENLLRIVFLQPPEIDGQYGYTSRVQDLKSRFNYVWDWCPRAVSVGIWDDVYLAVYRRLRLEDLRLRCRPETGGAWKVLVELDLEAFVAGTYEIEFLIEKGGQRLQRGLGKYLGKGRSSLEVELAVEEPDLWWPHGYGEQVLYDLKLSIRSEDGERCLEHGLQFGFRTVRLLPVSGAESSPAYTLEINGRSIPMRGVNWVPVSPFFGEAERGHYKRFLETFREMGCNILRVWGGGIVEKRSFYETCDRLGMMVWQEFPLSSSGIDNLPNQRAGYLKRLRRVAGDCVRRARNHPCHVIWCGGNELMYGDYTPVGLEHPTIQVLQETAAALDSGKPFLPASPSGPRFAAAIESMGRNLHHDVHGPWKYLGEEEHYRFFNCDDALLRTETGSPGAASAEALRFYAGGRDVWPPDASNPYWVHRGAWWLQLGELTRLFGGWCKEELDRYAAFSRYLQAEALRYAAAATLKRWPQASGFFVWMGNESFPNASNTSLLEFCGAAKPAYFALKRVFGPLFPGLAYPRLAYEPGAALGFLPFALCSGAPEPDCSLAITLHDGTGRILAEHLGAAPVGGTRTTMEPVDWRAPPAARGAVFFARVTAHRPGEAPAVETYPFCLREGAGRPALAAFRVLPTCRIWIGQTGGDSLLVKNVGTAAAVGLSLYDARIASPANTDRGFLTLLPGESEVLGGELASCTDWRERIRCEALNETVCLQLEGGASEETESRAR